MEMVGFIGVVVLWIVFAGALLFSQSSIHDMWARFKHQSLVLQVPLGILFLPWLIGMWVWESPWPVAARGILVGGACLGQRVRVLTLETVGVVVPVAGGRR